MNVSNRTRKIIKRLCRCGRLNYKSGGFDLESKLAAKTRKLAAISAKAKRLNETVETLQRENKRLRREKAHIEEKTLNTERVMLSRNVVLERFQDDLRTLVAERTRQFEEQAAIAEKASRAKGDFLASMSHEIRTPLNGIIGMVELMPTDTFSETQRRYFRDMTMMAHSLLDLINDILDFSKIEAGKMELVPSHYNLRSLFMNIASMFAYLADGKNLAFNAFYSPNLPDVVYGDGTRVRQILTNILNNAIKYTPKGRVDFSLSEDHTHIIACVNDTGIGIKDEEKEKLFGTFERLDKTRNVGVTGTGLGLAITKQLVDMMGGTITVESVYGGGSTFTVRLPLHPGDPAQVSTEQPEAALAQAVDGVKVLVVDDMRVNLTVAVGHLERHNIRADTAGSGEESIHKVKVLSLEEKHYDLIFMDHVMPGMDGFEAARKIRQIEGNQDIPIIAFSANAVQGVRELFLSAGMSDFLSKPLRSAELNKILKKWLPPRLQTQAAVTESSISTQYALPSSIAESLHIDMPAAFEFLGDKKKILAYLVSLERDCAEYIAALETACEQEDWTDYAVRVHGLKGAFRTLGIEDKAEMMLKLEKAAKEGRYKECVEKTPAALAALVDFQKCLAACPLPREGDTPV